jgi:HK97 family phage major capsid protein/HK97 family phage prohead protease
MQLNRAYSLLTIKKLADEERVIEGIASTPEVDRVGDIVEPMGAKFKVPMPLLWMHRADSPVGHVEFAQPTKDGIPFRARIAKIEEPGELKNLIDKAWQAVKAKLVGAVSIGFSIDKYEVMKEGGWKINEWFWHELSLVTIPANASATIHTIRSIDAEVLAASGQKQDSDERVVPAGVTAKATPVVKAKEAKRMAKKSIAEQISAFEATRQAKAAARDEIMETSAETGETLDAEQTEKYDGLVSEIKAIDAHLVRLNELEDSNKQKAVAVKAADGDEAARSRAGNGTMGGQAVRVSVRHPEVEKWVPFIRYAKAKLWSRLDNISAYEIAKNNPQWMHETPQVAEVLKAPVAVGTTTDTVWAGPLVNYQILSSQFAEFLRALTIIGRIPGLTRVPFKIRVPRQTTASTVNWVGEGAPKPLSSLAFDSITLDFAKIAGIVVITEELVRASDPAAEGIIRDDLTRSIVAFMDSQFVDPTKAATGISPASITNGVTALVPSGTTSAAFLSDLNRLFGQFLTNNLSLESAVLITTQQIAMRIGSLLNSFGVPMFPSASAQGGSIQGVPIVVSENIPSTTGSPTEGWPIILLSAREILLADDGQVTVDASREASLQMETAPDSPPTASTLYQSLWQTNSVGIRAERFINWVKRRSTAVSYISNAVYTG